MLTACTSCPYRGGSQGADGFLNLTLILDEQNGNTLVDAGLPGQAEAIGAALTEVGEDANGQLRRVVREASRERDE